MIYSIDDNLVAALELQKGLFEARAGSEDSSVILMTKELFHQLVGASCEEEEHLALDAIHEGLQDVDAGRTKPMNEVFRGLDQRYGIHD